MLNEFRQDIVTSEWVLYATNRVKGHIKTETEDKPSPISECPFENPQKSGNEKPILILNKGQKIEWSEDAEWTTQVLLNKFPALTHGKCGQIKIDGPFNSFDASGLHELVITHSHDRHFAQFTNDETLEVLRCYKERLEQMAKDDCGEYVFIFHNHGKKAGASQYHNHSQIMSLPIVPHNVIKNIRGAEEFYKKNDQKVFTALLNWELRDRKRIIYENEKFIALCPYVSKDLYEIKIFPKDDHCDFRQTDVADLVYFADALNKVLASLNEKLGNPDYNFYINTVPISNDSSVNHEYFRWHLDIMPRVNVLGGVELGVSVYVNMVDPNDAAELLRIR